MHLANILSKTAHGEHKPRYPQNGLPITHIPHSFPTALPNQPSYLIRILPERTESTVPTNRLKSNDASPRNKHISSPICDKAYNGTTAHAPNQMKLAYPYSNIPPIHHPRHRIFLSASEHILSPVYKDCTGRCAPSPRARRRTIRGARRGTGRAGRPTRRAPPPKGASSSRNPTTPPRCCSSSNSTRRSMPRCSS